MKKFYISLVAMFFAALTASAEDFMFNGLAYNITGTNPKTVEVTKPAAGYTSIGGELSIPMVALDSNGEGYVVASIGVNAFRECTNITSVIIPTSVETIGASAFYRCTKLKSVTFVSSHLKEILAAAFYETGLTSISLPSSVKVLGNDVFHNCTSLTTVTLPNSIESFRFEGHFEGCTSLQTVNIPNNSALKVLPGKMFKDCTSLKSITIPSNITEIGTTAFENSGLTSFTFPSTLKYLQDCVFRGCKGLTSITIPSTLEYPGYSQTFKDCTGLISVNIQNNRIGWREFSGCKNLKTVTIGSNVTSVPDDAFEGCPIETLTIGINGAANIALFPAAKTKLKTLTMNDGITELPESAFAGCSALTTVTLPSTLDGMGNAAFSGCTKMRELTAKMQRPFAIDASVFSGVQQHGYCDLHVPKGSKVRYSAMEVWKEFTVIDEAAGPSSIRGDVNSDGAVDIADVVNVLSIMAEQ